jgi:hypothetical protein
MERETMKPSERIAEIMQETGYKGNEWITYVPAILRYLDEQHEIHKEDIQIQQGR